MNKRHKGKHGHQHGHGPRGVGNIQHSGDGGGDDTEYAEGQVVSVGTTSDGCQVASVAINGAGGPTVSAVVPPHITMDTGPRDGQGEWIRIRRKRLRKIRRRHR